MRWVVVYSKSLNEYSVITDISPVPEDKEHVSTHDTVREAYGVVCDLEEMTETMES